MWNGWLFHVERGIFAANTPHTRPGVDWLSGLGGLANWLGWIG